MRVLSEQQVVEFILKVWKCSDAMKKKPKSSLMFGMFVSAAANELNDMIEESLKKILKSNENYDILKRWGEKYIVSDKFRDACEDKKRLG